MQVQKDEMRNKILEAATEEFLVNGYSQSSLRNIAAQAGMTVGNVYSYFSGKDDLFKNVVLPALEQMNILLGLEMTAYSSLSSPTLAQITEIITNAFICNRAQFFILMNGSAGSQYENVKQDITRLISKRLMLELFSKNSMSDPLLADAVAVSLLEGIITIFNGYGGDAERLKYLLKEFLFIVLGNLADDI
ncbi:MAG TPA: TetR/AcrR family transcriptional regulator [Candidatus Atribacteria bacterium]|nr:TetR/AcrR family transcriptional regulator [Candidatus Atribacteria bacterium]